MTWRQHTMLAVASVVIVVVWFGVRYAARHALGEPGFQVTVKDRSGAVVASRRATILFTPEVTPGPPPGGTLIARASFVARSAGSYTWKVGGTGHVELIVDGLPPFSPKKGLVYDTAQSLARGVHSVEVRLENADDNGAVVLAVVPPAASTYHLVDADDVVDDSADAVARRFDHRLIARLSPPTIATGLAALLFLALLPFASFRRSLRSLGGGIFTSRIGIALLLLVIAYPMVRRFLDPGYYYCHEGEGYTVRFVEYANALRDGVPMGRWWPDPIFGRGYPFLCLYAPLLYLIARPFLALGIAELTVVKLISAAIVLAGVGATYRIARRCGSRPAALIAAVLFAYAPYLQTDVWIRADIAESLGFACFPIALLALERALDAASPQRTIDIGFLAIAVAAVGTCHNVTAYFSAYFLIVWTLVRIVSGTVARDGLARTVWGAALGVLMMIFFAVPTLADVGRVSVERVTTGFYAPINNFVAVGKIITSPPRWGMRTYLGIPDTLLLVATVGVLALLWWRRRQRTDRAMEPSRKLALPALVSTLLTLALVTRPIGWFVVRHFPLAGNVQFPWRLFLFAACTAPLCAPLVIDTLLPSERWRWSAAAAITIAIIASLAPKYGPPSPLVRVHIHSAEYLRSIETDYVTSMNEYLPRTVRRTVPRFGDVAHIVAGQAVLSRESRSARTYLVHADAKDAAVVEFNAHWFPGWRAFVDGVEQPIGPGHDLFNEGGLVRVGLPPGAHDVMIRFDRTRLRLVCDVISLLALLAALGLVGMGLLRSRTTSPS